MDDVYIVLGVVKVERVVCDCILVDTVRLPES